MNQEGISSRVVSFNVQRKDCREAEGPLAGWGRQNLASALPGAGVVNSVVTEN